MGFWKKPASETQITHGDRLWLYVVALVIMLLLIIPTVIVVPMSFSDSQYLEFPPSHWSLRWYEEYFDSAKWMRSTMTSFQIGVLTMLVATPLGTMAAYALYVSEHRAARDHFCFSDHSHDRTGYFNCHRNLLCFRAARTEQYHRRVGAGTYITGNSAGNDHHHSGTSNL